MRRQLGILVAAAVIAVGATIGSGIGSRALADHVNQTQCYPYSGGQICYVTVGSRNTTTTPSGNISTHFDGTSTITVTDTNGNVVANESEDLHLHILYAADGTVQKEGGEHSTLSYSPGPHGGTCTVNYDIHVTSNGIQYDNFSQSGDCF